MNYLNIVPGDAVEIDKRMYYMSGDFNGFFYSDLGDEKAHFICSIPGEIINGKRLYESIHNVENRYIIMFPNVAEEIAIYDLATAQINKIEIPNEIKNSKMKFRPAVFIDSDIYLFGLFDTYIYRYSSNKMNLEVIGSWSDSITEEMIFDSIDSFFCYQTVVYDNKIYIPFCNINGILIYDYLNNYCEVKHFGMEKNGYSGIIMYNNSIICSPRNVGQKGLVWNLKTDSVQYLDVTDNIPIGIKVVKGEITYCLNENYSFVRSNDDYVYDRKKQVITYLDGYKNMIWNTKVIEDELKGVNGKLDDALINETKWLDLRRYLQIL